MKEKRTSNRKHKMSNALNNGICFLVARVAICFHKYDFYPHTESTSRVEKVKLMDRFRTIADFVSYFDNKINSFNFRNHIKNYPVHKQITYNQKQLQTDFLNSNECIDNMTSFSLRPPELLVISNVEIYFQCFQLDKKSESGKKLFAMAEKKELYPWVDCCGHFCLYSASGS